MPDKRVLTIFTLILMSISLKAATNSRLQSYFSDSKSDIASNNQNTMMARSFETKVYTLDMLHQSEQTRELYSDIDLRYFNKKAKLSIDHNRNNKYGLIIDLDVKKHSTLEIYNDSAYMEYLQSVSRNDILKYLKKLNSRNEKNLPSFVNESSRFFDNAEFLNAYADYLLEKSKKNLDEIINYYLHGGEFASAANLLESSTKFSNSQKVKVLELAKRYNEAYELCHKTDSKNYERLSQLATACEEHENAYQHYLMFQPNDHQMLAKLSHKAGNFPRALEHARKNPSEDEFMLDLFVKTENNYEAFIFAKNTNKSIADTMLVLLTDREIEAASKYFADKSEFIYAYTLLKKVNLHHNIEQSLQYGIDQQLDNLATDKDVNQKQKIANALGSNDQIWTEERARLVENIVLASEKDLGYYYDLCDKNDLAYQYYLDTHQYIKAIDYHQRYLSNTAIPIDNNTYSRAGMDAEAKNQTDLAISFYKLGGAANNQRLSELYRKKGEYDQAISYQLQADPNANQILAELYELNWDYQGATEYYRKAGILAKALENAVKIGPKNYPLLIELNNSLDRHSAVNDLLEEYYDHDYLSAGNEFVRLDKQYTYIAKLVFANKLDAIDKYNFYSKIPTESLDKIIESLPASGHNAAQKKVICERLTRYIADLEDLSIDEIAVAIKLAEVTKDTSKKTTLAIKLKEKKARIEKEEREEKARIAAQEKENRARRNGVYEASTRSYVSMIRIEDNQWLQMIGDSRGDVYFANAGTMVGNDLYDDSNEYIGYYQSGKIYIKSGMVFYRK